MNPQQAAQVKMMKLGIPKQKGIVAMKKKILEARERENIAERQFISSMMVPEIPTLAYCAALRDRWLADKDFYQFEIFEMEEQIKAMEEMVKHGESPIVGVVS